MEWDEIPIHFFPSILLSVAPTLFIKSTFFFPLDRHGPVDKDLQTVYVTVGFLLSYSVPSIYFSSCQDRVVLQSDLQSGHVRPPSYSSFSRSFSLLHILYISIQILESASLLFLKPSGIWTVLALNQ